MPSGAAAAAPWSVDTSSVPCPPSSRAAAAQAGRAGVELIDCPVSGGAEAAAEGRLSAMCGGARRLWRVFPPCWHALPPA